MVRTRLRSIMHPSYRLSIPYWSMIGKLMATAKPSCSSRRRRKRAVAVLVVAGAAAVVALAVVAAVATVATVTAGEFWGSTS